MVLRDAAVAEGIETRARHSATWSEQVRYSGELGGTHGLTDQSIA